MGLELSDEMGLLCCYALSSATAGSHPVQKSAMSHPAALLS